MPELPEVEVVRRGLSRWVTGTTIRDVEVLHPRPVRRHLAGPQDFAARLAGVKILDVVRRGKFLWLPLDSGDALMAHLGMSGQMLLEQPGEPDEKHLRVRLGLEGGTGRELRFVDQRMFGGLSIERMVPTPDGRPGGLGGVPGEEPGPEGAGAAFLPEPAVHIARDVLDPDLDAEGLSRRMRGKRTDLKRALLDQTLVSGIGNIYADEALWRAKLHPLRPTAKLTRPQVSAVMAAARDVMLEALAQGGTSFDSLYVDVNGNSGYFERGLAVYGREGRPCPRCGTLVRRDSFANRSSFTCPRCQPKPRSTSQR